MLKNQGVSNSSYWVYWESQQSYMHIMFWRFNESESQIAPLLKESEAEVFKETLWACANIMGELNSPALTYG